MSDLRTNPVTMGVKDDAQLAIHVLGQPQLFYAGRPFKFAASRKALALVAYLILKRRAPVSRSVVTLAIWPDEDEADARVALRRELHRAAKALAIVGDEPCFIADSTEVRWNDRANVWLDIATFESALQEADADRLREAVALYRGELLDGLDDEWICAERERLRTSHAGALGRLLASARGVRDYASAIDYAGRILTEDPFREDVVRTLISLRFESGDRAGALREAQRYSKLYREELGIGLMPETEALRFAISRGEAGVDEADVAVVVRDRARRIAGLVPAFAGRVTELATAQALWRRATRGVGGAIFVSGEAGIGKSRLVEELALVAERQGGRVLVGHTSAPERLPYEALATALAHAVPLLDSVRADPSTRGSLERIVPGLAGPVPPERPRMQNLPDADREQVRLFASLEHYVAALARTRPLLIVLEDIHWARPSTLSALRSLAAAAAKSRVLLIATMREESMSDVLSALRRDLVADELAVALPLPRLAPDETRSIARSIGRAAAFDDAQIEALVGFSEGNPFYLVEGVVGFAKPGAVLPTASAALGDMINARVEQMDDAVIDVASIAANIGERFTLEALRAVCGMDEAVLLDGIGKLIEEHVLAETAGRTSFDYTFTHHLLRNAIYERIPAEKRRRRHRLIARVFEQHAGSVSGMAIDVARHYAAAGADAEAARWYCAAGVFAARSYANEEAGALFDRSLELATDAAARFETLVERATLRGRLDDDRGESGDLVAMAELAESLDDEARFRVLFRRADRALRIADVAGAEIAVRLLHEHPYRSSEDGVVLAIFQTRLDVLRGRTDDAEAAARAGWTLVDAATPDFEAAELLCHLAGVLFSRGDLDEGTVCLSRAMELSSSEDANAALIARTNLAAAAKAYASSAFENSERFATASIDAARIVGDRGATVDALAARSVARRSLRRLAEARADIDAAIDICGPLERPASLGRLMLRSCMIDADSGELARAIDVCDTIIGGGVAVFGAPCLASAYNAKAFCAGLSGDMPVARLCAQRALDLWDASSNRIHGAYALSNLGTIEREMGELELGRKNIERALEILRPILDGNELVTTRAEQALTYAEIGDARRSRAIVAELVNVPVSGTGLSWQHMMFLTIWKTSSLIGEADFARSALNSAARAFDLHFEAVPEDSREQFLAIPLHRELIAAAQSAGVQIKGSVPSRSA